MALIKLPITLETTNSCALGYAFLYYCKIGMLLILNIKSIPMWEQILV